ncbi:deleted in malignant brain tumors 1 protein-like [Strongylocentrotus purpuratus]|uniref:SRCR domain-containing protein n=1 Tax=Strongylocentrotus purpuratus TaxID=7668 RepID=A0A7M7NC53_STRPU|nr:deleted in malignant brain tumors 1 protein-like [Strongylocentrotus purpuratus]
MLGFDGALDAPRSARFGQGSGDILYIDCFGSEDSLSDCLTWVDSSCEHHMDIGAVCYSGANPEPFQVRLVGGSHNAEGRVEVLHGGSWGTICDDSWDLRDARVVCRMLGFDGALDAPGSARFGQGSGRILLTYVNCGGTENNLADCAHPGIGDYNYCAHSRDTGVICYSGVRLVGGSNDAEGRVEVLNDGSWGTICDTWWDLRDARVVCRMLGFDGALDAPKSARFGQGSGRFLLNLVNCDGTEDNLVDCAHSGIGDYYYLGHCRDAGVICYSGAHPNSEGVRLMGGSNSSEGRVEIRYNGTWGTVCDDGWDLKDAKVVCRMLGFGDASAASGAAQFGEGSDEVLLSLAGCDGTEDNLADCAHLGFGVHNCHHDEDAGVTCLLGGIVPIEMNNIQGPGTQPTGHDRGALPLIPTITANPSIQHSPVPSHVAQTNCRMAQGIQDRIPLQSLVSPVDDTIERDQNRTMGARSNACTKVKTVPLNPDVAYAVVNKKPRSGKCRADKHKLDLEASSALVSSITITN